VPSKTAQSQAAAFDAQAASAGAQVVSAEFFFEQLIVMNEVRACLMRV
jgi:hypothetical protein